jgi:hypothetical protein
MRQPKMYFVNIRAKGFVGWNSVYAISLKEAKSKLLAKLGKKTYDDIIWESLKTGKLAEAEDRRMEDSYRGMFD